jgi:peptidoglycan/xylan/chitin deacetylase (PgdA/CDA1 family)
MLDKLNIIMYHYVRDLDKTRYPTIKGRTLSEFRYQIEYLKKYYNPITMLDVVNCIRASEPLPPKAVLLTFDDGYIDHYTNVFPILFDAGIEGSFFPPAASVNRGELLDVNRIHFILAAEPNHQNIAANLDEVIIKLGDQYSLKKPSEYRSAWAKPSTLDNAETIYIKRMLQLALPEKLRNLIAKKLFSQYVSIDEKTFANELYCTPDQLKVMQASGMYIGSHGDSHYWLNAIDANMQHKEIEESMSFLREIGSPVDKYWAMCYPYGAWNESLLNILRKYNCTLGLTTELGVANLNSMNSLLLPRIDTNYIPYNIAAI